MNSPFRIVFVFLAICLIGVLSLPSLNINLYPQSNFKTLYISYKGLSDSPARIEQSLTSKLENAFSSLSDIKKITSSSKYNSAQIELVFDKHVDLELKKIELTVLLRQLKKQLPENVGHPVISQQVNGDKNEDPLLIYTINSRTNNYLLQSKVKELVKKPLSSIKGIKEINIDGQKGLQIVIEFRKPLLSAYHLELDKIINKVKLATQTNYPGSVKLNQNKLFIKVRPVDNLDDLKNLLLTNNQTRVRLKDIANIYRSNIASDQYFRVNGGDALTLQVYSQKGINTVNLAKKVKEKVKEISRIANPSLEIHLSYDGSNFLRSEINKNLKRTAFSLIILTVFIFLAYRNWRHLVNLLLTLTVNLVLTILAVWALNINIHLYSLAGIAIAFGIMIDHGIVMLDYYRQFQNRKVFLALLGATLTTVAALLLVFLLSEEESKNLIDFAVIICLALATSLFTNLFFTVGLYRLLSQKSTLKKSRVSIRRQKRSLKTYKIYFRFIHSINKYKTLFIVSIVLLLGIPVFLLPEKMEESKLYNSTLGSTIYQEKIKPITDKFLGGAFRIFKQNVIENSEYRDFNETKLYVYADLPIGATSNQMNEIILGFENFLNKITGIDRVISNVYSGQLGKIEISFKEGFENTPLPYRVKTQLIARAEGLGGVNWNIFGVGQGFNKGTGNEIPKFKVKLMGYNYDVLEQNSFHLANRLKQYSRIQKINTDQPMNYYEKPGEELLLSIDDRKLKNTGIYVDALFKSLQEKTEPGNYCCETIVEGVPYPVLFKEKESENFNKWNLLHTSSLGSKMSGLELKDYTSLNLEKTAGTIFKENRQYVRFVGFEYLGTEQYGNKYLEKELKEIRKGLPIGYTIKQDKNVWNWQENQNHYYLVLLLLFCIWCICAILFENITYPLIIVLTIPISFIGIFLIYGFGNFYFDQGGFASFIMVGGLVANAGIFIINDYNNLKSVDNENKRLIKAVYYRSRTILLTTIAAICGVIPFITEGQKEIFWFSFAIGTIGGLIFSAFAIFIFLPVIMFKRNYK